MVTKASNDAITNEPIQGSEANAPDSVLDAKWGDGLMAGYQILPNALVRNQRILKLSATDMVVIANLNQAWWFEDRPPYLRPQTIARRMGVATRTVQRSLSKLRELELLKQVREWRADGTMQYHHDLTGLKIRVEDLARRDAQFSASSAAERKATARPKTVVASRSAS